MGTDTGDPTIEINVAIIKGHPYVKWVDVTEALELIDQSPQGMEETDTWCSIEAMEVAGAAVMAATEAPPGATTVTADNRTYCVEIPVVAHIQQLREIGGD